MISPWDDGDNEVSPHEAEDKGAGEEEVEDGDPHPAKDDVDVNEKYEHLPIMRGKQRKAISPPEKFDLILQQTLIFDIFNTFLTRLNVIKLG